MKRIIPALAIVALALTGCSSWTGEGTVTDKSHRGAYTITTMVMSGKVMVPIITHMPECYELEVQAKDDGKKRDYCFKQDAWNNYELGSRIHITKETK